MYPFWDSSLLASSTYLNHSQGHWAHVALGIFLFLLSSLVWIHPWHKSGEHLPVALSLLNIIPRTTGHNATKTHPKKGWTQLIHIPIQWECVHISLLPPSPIIQAPPEWSGGENHLANHWQRSGFLLFNSLSSKVLWTQPIFSFPTHHSWWGRAVFLTLKDINKEKAGKRNATDTLACTEMPFLSS